MCGQSSAYATLRPNVGRNWKPNSLQSRLSKGPFYQKYQFQRHTHNHEIDKQYFFLQIIGFGLSTSGSVVIGVKGSEKSSVIQTSQQKGEHLSSDQTLWFVNSRFFLKGAEGYNVQEDRLWHLACRSNTSPRKSAKLSKPEDLVDNNSADCIRNSGGDL